MLWEIRAGSHTPVGLVGEDQEIFLEEVASEEPKEQGVFVSIPLFLAEHSLSKEVNHGSYQIRSFIPHMFIELFARRQAVLLPGAVWGLESSCWEGEKWIREILEEIKPDSQVSSLGKWVDSGSGLPCAGVQVVDSYVEQSNAEG